MFTLPPDPPAIIGRASVVDGDTIEIQGQRIRLWGIDAPEGRQTCERGGQAYRCGTEAANALDGLLTDKTVTCNPVGRPDRYRRIVARCWIKTDTKEPVLFDIGSWMVSSGNALDYPRYSSGFYQEFQAEAKRDGLGVWAGEFQVPWEWRRR